jgi:hypothetical protein
MAFSNQAINNFWDRASSIDFARQNLFRVISITGGQGGSAGITESDLVYLTSTTLPGRAINNVPVPFMGLSFNVPGTANYPNSAGWTINFRMDSNQSIRTKLENWSRSIFDDAKSTGVYSVGNQSTITIALMDKAGSPIRTYKLIGSYLVNVGEQTLDVTTAGELITQAATIAYSYWELAA